mmetsp:Transcript_13649/g.29558  ORF Transcript_13649/g.29558 Transcript_13649/m.29558 type:complete len:208 (+) Transcript_13649:187-810(+)
MCAFVGIGLCRGKTGRDEAVPRTRTEFGQNSRAGRVRLVRLRDGTNGIVNKMTMKASTPAEAGAIPVDDAQWVSVREMLVERLEISGEDADKALKRAFAWGSQIYWRKKREQEIPSCEAVLPTLEYLSSELELNAAQTAAIVKGFPEVLGVSLEKRIKPNVDRIKTEWNMRNPRLKNSILENPDCLGYDIDCLGDCAGECARCWARF